MDTLLRERYTCTPICRVVTTLLRLSGAIGPAGDVLYLPLRNTGGTVPGLGTLKHIVFGSDLATLRPDEKLLHDGNWLIGDAGGDVLMAYTGTSQTEEGAFDDMLERELPGRIPSWLNVRVTSTNAEWRWLNERPLLCVGWFDGESGTLDIMLLTVNERATEN